MRNRLKQLLKESNWNIIEEVIKEALEYENPKDFFEDLLQYWCKTWMVCSLILYRDTHNFFEKHYKEIEEIRTELEEQWIEVKIPTNADLKNFLAWLSFEQRAYEFYNNFDFER